MLSTCIIGSSHIMPTMESFRFLCPRSPEKKARRGPPILYQWPIVGFILSERVSFVLFNRKTSHINWVLFADDIKTSHTILVLWSVRVFAIVATRPGIGGCPPSAVRYPFTFKKVTMSRGGRGKTMVHIDCAVLIASGTGFDQTVFFIRRDVPSLTDP